MAGYADSIRTPPRTLTEHEQKLLLKITGEHRGGFRDHVIIANACQVAGHVTIEDMAIIEGAVGVVQFLRIGRMAFVGAMSKITKDLPPYMIGHGDPLEVRGFNKVGLERRGVDEAGRKTLKEAYRILYRQKLTVAAALEKIEAELEQTPEVKYLLEFCRASEKGIAR